MASKIERGIQWHDQIEQLHYSSQQHSKKTYSNRKITDAMFAADECLEHFEEVN